MVKKSFLVFGITNALEGSENGFIRCAKELPTLQVPYIDDSNDGPFQDELEESVLVVNYYACITRQLVPI